MELHERLYQISEAANEGKKSKENPEAKEKSQKVHDQLVDEHLTSVCEMSAGEGKYYAIIGSKRLADGTYLSEDDIIKYVKKHNLEYYSISNYCILAIS